MVFQAPMLPFLRHCPRASSRCNSGIPSKRRAMKYGIRKAPENTVKCNWATWLSASHWNYWFVICLLYDPNKVLVGCVERGSIARDTCQVMSVTGDFDGEDVGGRTGLLSAAGHFPSGIATAHYKQPRYFLHLPFLLSIFFSPPAHKAQGFASPLYCLFPIQCIISFPSLKFSGACSSIFPW